MMTRLFTIVSTVSLLLCIATLVLWGVDRGNARPNLQVVGAVRVFGYRFMVGDGGFSVHYYRALPKPLNVARADESLDADLVHRAIGRPWERLDVRHRPVAQWDWEGTQRPPRLVGAMHSYSAHYRLVAGLAAVLPLLWAGAVAWGFFRRKHIPGTCLACGYDLRASESRCPECGKTFTREVAGRSTG